jgi:methyltransferase (TIGR00027 family)
MRSHQSSLTAMGIAIARAVESEKPETERICYDPYARRFVPGWLYAPLAFFIRSGYTEWRGPGVGGFLVARERYIDDVLEEFLDRGLQQLVILGAGYDSRAYRFERLSGRVKVFEVDHPATQKDKMAKVRNIFGMIPAGVTYVAVDFNRQKLAERLPEAGFDRKRKTLCIWQGVTMYLTAEAVDSTLQFIVRNSAPGSAVVFDYVYRQTLEERRKHGEIHGMHRYRFMTGEGLTFGIDPERIGDFLKERGFYRVQNIDSEGLRRAYCTGKNSKRTIASGYGIAVAEV